jgi:hypothetical protein
MGPIPRHCADTKSRAINSREWCVDCCFELDVENEGRRGERRGNGEGKEGREAVSSETGWAGSVRGSRRERRGFPRRWTGYTGMDGRESWRDDVPQ